jgi:hypothetical protein
MSWHFLRGQVEESWEGSCLDGAPDVLLRLIPTAGQCYLQDNEMGCSQSFQYGMTLEHFKAYHGVVMSMLLQEAFHAKTSVRLVNVKAYREKTQNLFLRCSELLRKFNLSLSSPKTVRTYVQMGLILLSKPLPAWGMWDQSGYWGLGTSVRPIDEIGCGLLLPTPTTKGNEFSESMQKWPLHQNLKKRLLPTPTAKLYGYNQGGGAGRIGKKRSSLETLFGGIKIALREWMMGWPIGWTALKPLGMGKYRQWRRLHGKCWVD